jgi:hypothetical protein
MQQYYVRGHVFKSGPRNNLFHNFTLTSSQLRAGIKWENVYSLYMISIASVIPTNGAK